METSELRVPADFPKGRYNMLDTSAVRFAYHGLKGLIGHTHYTHVERAVSSPKFLLVARAVYT